MNTLAEEFKGRPATVTLTLVLIFTLILGFIGALLQRHFGFMLLILCVIALIILPWFFEHLSKIVIPTPLQIFTICFTYAALYLGEINNYYAKYLWWDSVLHASSGVAFSIVGFLFLYIISVNSRVRVNPWTIALFSFCFALAIGALWEIVEFTLDQTIGTVMQGASLNDTMKDLIVDSIGALVASILGWLYLKKKTGFFVHHVILEFRNKNPWLFIKKKYIQSKTYTKLKNMKLKLTLRRKLTRRKIKK